MYIHLHYNGFVYVEIVFWRVTIVDLTFWGTRLHIFDVSWFYSVTEWCPYSWVWRQAQFVVSTKWGSAQRHVFRVRRHGEQSCLILFTGFFWMQFRSVLVLFADIQLRAWVAASWHWQKAHRIINLRWKCALPRHNLCWSIVHTRHSRKDSRFNEFQHILSKTWSSSASSHIWQTLEICRKRSIVEKTRPNENWNTTTFPCTRSNHRTLHASSRCYDPSLPKSKLIRTRSPPSSSLF